MNSDVLDMEVVEDLLSLTGDGDPELLLDLINMFLEDTPGRLQDIQHSLEAGDLQAMAAAAHSLKGSSGNLGAWLLQEDCQRLQVAGQHNLQDEAQQALPAMEQHCREALAALVDLREQLR